MHSIQNDTARFEKAMDNLRDGDAPFAAETIYSLSDLAGERLETFFAVWSGLPAERRRGLIARLVETAETNFELDFSAIVFPALEDRDEQIRKVNAGYREKSAATRQWIDSDLGPWLAGCRGGSAGFYYYPTFQSIETHEASAFLRFLSRTTGDPAVDGAAGARNPRVAYIPGQICVHRQGELVDVGRRQLRLSYGFEDLPRIRQAIHLIKEAAEYAASMR